MDPRLFVSVACGLVFGLGGCAASKTPALACSAADSCGGSGCAGCAGEPSLQGGAAGLASAGRGGAGAGGAGAGAAVVGGAGAGAGMGAAGVSGQGGVAPAADSGGAGAPAGTGGDDCGICDGYGMPMMLTTIGVSALDALSGLASSRKHPGVIYAHNDHDRPNVYALNMSGQLLTRYDLDVSATDTEDIAVGSCPDGSCVYFADIGDNAASRASYAVYRFAEPDLPAMPSDRHQNVAFERFPFVYEDGSHNAEGLFVAPDGGAIYIVTKPASGAASVYRIAQPYQTTGMNRAVKAADLPIPSAGDEQTSAAAGHPCGLGFLVRTYNKVYEFRIARGMPFESAFGVQPNVAAMPDEMQSEGIDYFPDGRGFLSSGEGKSAPIMATRCR